MATSSEGSDAFRAFEHDAWERASSGYHSHWEHLTTQIVPAILKAGEVGPLTVLLDVACGPGYVAGLSARLGAVASGIDLSGEMVRLAAQNYPQARFQTGDAQDLPFEDARFDVVTINFGVMHFPEPEAGLADAMRVLKPGGRLVFTSWAQPENSAIGFAMDAVARFGTTDVDLPAGPPFFRFGPEEECARVAGELGFEDCRHERHLLYWTLPAPDALMDALREATARASALLNAQRPEDLPAIRAAMVERCAPFVRDGKAMVPMPATLCVAQKPA
ncbi:class I SAM-dependent methyltransferase [Tepidamorphus sp. 3E244]|uniref:class I SAM-dependent methyltransferase n=1 Tax=Tepidamorphus sp. 3E244 TaxID=3385498 RepID=UPI0038FCAF1D